MRKAGELGLIECGGSRSLMEEWVMGFCLYHALFVDYISGEATGSFSTAFGAHTGIGTFTYYLVRFLRTKNKNYVCQNWLW